MVNLTPTQVKKVLQLQEEYFTVQQQIIYINSLITQLASDPCTLKVDFTMHNEDQCDAKAALPIGIVEISELQSFNPAAIIAHFMRSQNSYHRGGNVKQQDRHNSCKKQLAFSVTEGAGMRILNAVLVEKKESLDLLLAQIEEILIPEMKVELTMDPYPENPILQLYSKP